LRRCNKYSCSRGGGEHLSIGIAALDLLRRDLAALHSRKPRSFDEPPFR
jgi:AMP nucleosidase